MQNPPPPPPPPGGYTPPPPPPPPPGGYTPPPPPPPPPGGYTPPPPPPPPPGGYTPAPPPQMPAGYQPAYPAPTAYASQTTYAGFWIRVVAYIIDAIIIGIVAGIFSVPFNVNYSDINSGSYRASNGVQLLVSGLYFIGLWTYMGASLGQRIFGMRVVDATTGQPLTVGKAAIRWVGLLLAFVVCAIGVIWVAFDSRKQGWADKIAGTVVLRG